jgi:aromatic-L-amino-acid decarboxylase
LENVVHVEADAEFRMKPDALAAAIAADRERGYLPMACVATIGTTSTSSIDPVPAIAEICRRESVWLHVDGAYGGVLAIVPENRYLLDGVDTGADSLVVNPHKWLFTPFDCSVFYVKKPEILKRAFSLVPEYLVTREQDSVVNYMDYGVQLGRRFRALTLWMVIRAFGVDGLIERLREHRGLAQKLAGWIEETADWELAAPVPFSLVCFRFAPAGISATERDRLNEAIMHAVNASGVMFISHTKLSGRFTLRLSIGNIRTGEGQIAAAWDRLQSAAKLSS